MARLLIVVPPLSGHVAPLAGVAAELAARGHDVAWAGSPRVISSVAGPGATVYPAGPDPDGQLPGRPGGLRAFAALRHLWERFLVPLAEEMLPQVDEAILRQQPDLLICDQQAFAGPLAALRHELPWVTSASTSAELGDPFAGLPRIAAWIDALQTRMRRDADVRGPDLRFSPHLTLCFSTPGLAGDPAPGAGPVRMVGTCVGGRAEPPAFPWHLLDPRRTLVLLTLGTTNDEAGPRFLDACRTGLAGLPDVQSVVVSPDAADAPGACPAGAGPRSEREIVLPRVPQLQLLRHASAVISHGGHNTVVESLREGVPLLVAPIRDDQPIVAGQVVAAGAGLQVRFDRAGPDEIAGAVRELLTRPGYVEAAARLARELDAAGGAPAAADAVEQVLAEAPRTRCAR